MTTKMNLCVGGKTFGEMQNVNINDWCRDFTVVTEKWKAFNYSVLI